jgi:ABC-2 type transport system ATP-binding protein
MSIDVKGLIKNYGEQKAVNEVSFSVSKGEIVGFLGPNGAGKSTTMKMITGYLEPDQGDIKVCGISVKDQPLEIKKKIGYLPEANPLYFDMYIREYLDFIAGVHHVANPSKKIEEVIDLTGLRPESSKKIGQLSKGYKQRVGLAAALIHDPEVLILDEPTTGLDPNQIIEIREVIRRLGKDKTVLFSSHILQEVEALCDRVIIINKGQLVADDSISKLHARKKGQYVKVTFGQAPEKNLIESISGTTARESADGLTWTIETTNPDFLRKQLMELSLQHNLNIVSLQSETSSLEDIFRDLTSAKNNA